AAGAANNGALTDGTYQYVVTFIDGNGVESNPSPILTVTVAGSGTGTTITLSSIPIGPTGTAARLIYRSPANGTASYFVARVGDNVTASIPDNLPDSALINMAVRASAPVPDVTAMTATAKASGDWRPTYEGGVRRGEKRGACGFRHTSSNL